MTVWNGPIVSIAIRVIGDTIDRTNRGAFITVCNGIIVDKWDNIRVYAQMHFYAISYANLHMEPTPK